MSNNLDELPLFCHKYLELTLSYTIDFILFLLGLLGTSVFSGSDRIATSTFH